MSSIADAEGAQGLISAKPRVICVAEMAVASEEQANECTGDRGSDNLDGSFLDNVRGEAKVSQRGALTGIWLAPPRSERGKRQILLSPRRVRSRYTSRRTLLVGQAYASLPS